MARGFGLQVLCHDPNVLPEVFEEVNAKRVDLHTLLKQADFISVNCALNRETRHMIGLEEFRKMKPTAYLINTGRGSMVDEEALATALREGSIAGAALDVLEHELIGPGDSLFGLENVILTGHVAFYSEQATAETRHRAYEQVRQILEGEWPTWLLNPEVKRKYQDRWGSDRSEKDEGIRRRC
jgi:D-3-phosphoglycerate dehydrogenase